MIVYPAFLAFFLASAYSASINEGPLVGTTGDVPILEVPYMASIHYVTGFELHGLCGGSIISDKYVLTSAGCVKGFKDLRVRIGTDHSKYGGVVYSVSKIIIHEEFMKEPNYADIAILKLNNIIKFNEKIGKINLLPNATSLQININVNVTGWGCSKGFRLNDHLQQVTVPIRKVADCISTASEIDQPIICAGAAGGEYNVCLGDIGGPLTYNGVQYGIVSYPESMTKNGLGIYTKIRTFYTWIVKTMQTN